MNYKNILIVILVVVVVVFGTMYFSSKEKVVAPNEEMTQEDKNIKESTNVEKYLRENISTLSPVPAVLGGTWYVVSVVTDINTNSGVVVYEDGHIQEKRNFSYEVDGNINVTILTIGGEVKEASTGGNLPVATSGTVFTAKLGQTITLSGVEGTLSELVEDSRCPASVQCIQAGTVRVKVNFKYGLLSQNVTLKLSEPFTMSGRSITLIGVKPAKLEPGTISSADYSFTFEIK